MVNRPTRIFQGTSDDYNLIATCKAYVNRLRSAGHGVQLTEYPSAQHVFDNPIGSQMPVVVKDGQAVRHCAIQEEPVGHLINATTKQPFTYNDPCVERDPHVAYDPAALEASKRSVKDLPGKVLKVD